jgi:cytochrome c biogenesis protein CcmG/thiol:disulfide interchange protein DsbE
LSSPAATAPSPWVPRLAALTAGLGVVALLALLVWGLGRVGTVGQVPVANREAPSFELSLFGQPGSSGGVWRLGAAAGRPVVLNFWASWCLPCEEEAPVLERLAGRYAGRVEFVGVAVQDTEAASRGFLQRFRVTYPNGPDPSGEISIAYGMSGVPETYFIDRNGRIARKWAGPLDEAKLTAYVDELLR